MNILIPTFPGTKYNFYFKIQVHLSLFSIFKIDILFVTKNDYLEYYKFKFLYAILYARIASVSNVDYEVV